MNESIKEKKMNEKKDKKWYKDPTIIGSIITGIFSIIAIFVGFMFDSNEQSHITQEPTRIVTPDKPKPTNPPNSYLFHDDFEKNLSNWFVESYTGYNNFMKWHISKKDSYSSSGSISVGHEETDEKDNDETVSIVTKKSFILTQDSKLEFKIKKGYKINLKFFLLNSETSTKENIKFFPGNYFIKDWKIYSLPLYSHSDKGKFKILLQAWGQGNFYIDDILLTN
ncbi:MAG: hypothetical protein GY756_11875 [bacterium]|nr:hypothetical protein [bacterium]